MMLYLFLLLKSFKLEIRFINIQQGTLTFADSYMILSNNTVEPAYSGCIKRSPSI